MKINAKTKISELIKHNNNVIEVIAAINPHFNKLKNPILRKVLAPRVTIEDAARIGKCKVEDFFSALGKIGFTVETQLIAEPPKEASQNEMIIEVINSGKIKVIDVRPTLDSGSDPFNHIMRAINELPDGFALEVINTFEPTPLINILNKKGYMSFIKTEGDLIKTYFTKGADDVKQVEKEDALCTNLPIEELESERTKLGTKCRVIDVRDMEMPLPMVTILSELEQLKGGEALYVHHKKVPQYLLPELKDRKFNTFIAELGEGNVKLLILK